MDLFEQQIKLLALNRPYMRLDEAVLEADAAVEDAKARRTYTPSFTGREPTREELAEAILQTPAVMDYLNSDTGYRKINAIKEARALFSVGLKEAKDGVELVEEWRSKGYNPPMVTREDELKAIESVMETMHKEAPDAQ